jgi:hypothetical protein
MILAHSNQHLPQSFKSRKQLAPAHNDPQFPYDVNQFKQIVCLSSRRSRVFIRSNFELGTDYKVVGTKHTMMLSRQCLAVAVAMQFKFSNFPGLIDQDYLPHYKEYQTEILAAVARKQSRRGAGRRKISPGQLSFKFVGSAAIIVLPDLA